MRRRTLGTSALAIAAVCAGRWGFADPVRPADSGARVRAERHDERAKANALRLAEAMRSCFARTRDYTPCEPAGARAMPKRAIGAGPGQADVVAVNPTDFTVSSYSASGAQFTLHEAATGATERTCVPAGGSCAADGRW